MLLKVKVEKYKILVKFSATSDIMSLTVQINVALRERICLKFGSERVNMHQMTYQMTFY